MANTRDPTTDPRRPLVYHIRIKGHLGRQWMDWFGGLTITPEANGDTLLTGPVVDQAALHGLLRKVRDLGLPLLSVMRREPGHAEAAAVTEEQAPSPLVRGGREAAWRAARCFVALTPAGRVTSPPAGRRSPSAPPPSSTSERPWIQSAAEDTPPLSPAGVPSPSRAPLDHTAPGGCPARSRLQSAACLDGGGCLLP